MRTWFLIGVLLLVPPMSYAADECSPPSYDVNHDHQITVADALVVLRGAVGLQCYEPIDTVPEGCAKNLEDLSCKDSGLCIVRFEDGVYCCDSDAAE